MLKQKMDELQGKLDSIYATNISLKTALDELQAKRKEIELQKSLVEKKKKLVEGYVGLVASISEEVLRARSEFIVLTGVNKTEKANALASLQARCKHQLVLGYLSWRGWACENYYGGFSGKRICVICGLQESPWNTYDEDLYKVLVEAPGMIMGKHAGFRPTDDYYDRDGNFCVRYIEGQSPPLHNIWQPLENLLTIFETGELGEVLSK